MPHLIPMQTTFQTLEKKQRIFWYEICFQFALRCGVLVLELANLVHKLKIFGIYPWKTSLSSHLYLRNSRNYYQIVSYSCIYHFRLVLSEQKKVEACDGTIFGWCAFPAVMFMMTMWKPINTYPIFSNCWFYDHFVSIRTPLNIF
jgi:hypothetical protein